MAHRTQLAGIPAPPQQPPNPDDLDDWLNAVVGSRAAEQEREIRYNALTSAINQCDAEIAAVVDVFPDGVLAALGDDMSDLMARVDDAVDRLGGVGDTWNELRTLRDNYD